MADVLAWGSPLRRLVSDGLPHRWHDPVMIPLTADMPGPPPFARTATFTARGPKKRPSRIPPAPNVAAKVVAPVAKLVCTSSYRSRVQKGSAEPDTLPAVRSKVSRPLPISWNVARRCRHSEGEVSRRGGAFENAGIAHVSNHRGGMGRCGHAVPAVPRQQRLAVMCTLSDASPASPAVRPPGRGRV
jgi:hypothetical protein